MPEMVVRPAVRSARNRLQKWQALSWPDRWLLVEALLWLALMGAAIHCLPFRRLIGLLRLEAGQGVLADAPTLALRVGWAVNTTARRTPWLSTCLAQALAGKIMLRRRKVPATLYLGVAKSPADDLQAHAWLRCGERIVTGQVGHERFNVIAQYA